VSDEERNRGRIVRLVGHVADFGDHSFQPTSDLAQDLYAREAIALLGELCGQVLAGDVDATDRTVTLLEQLERMVTSPVNGASS
jgi:hypothetical protein